MSVAADILILGTGELAYWQHHAQVAGIFILGTAARRENGGTGRAGVCAWSICRVGELTRLASPI